jgi:hypothetical protein
VKEENLSVKEETPASALCGERGVRVRTAAPRPPPRFEGESRLLGYMTIVIIAIPKLSIPSKNSH